MRRMFGCLAAASMSLLVMSPAQAASRWSGCAVGPEEAGPSTIGSWQLWDRAAYVEGLLWSGYTDDEALAYELAEPAFAKDDRNGDGLLCVMTQQLPTDSSGFDIWFVSHDNVAKNQP